VEITGSTASGTHRYRAGQMRFGSSRERCNLLVAYVLPLYSPLTSNSVRQSIEAISNDAVDALNAGRHKNLRNLVSDGLHVLHPILV